MLLPQFFWGKSFAGLLALCLISSFIACLWICADHLQANNADSLSHQSTDTVAESGCYGECQVLSTPAILPERQSITSMPGFQTQILVDPANLCTGHTLKPTPTSSFAHDPPRERLCVFRI